jgi:hypothetical protein
VYHTPRIEHFYREMRARGVPVEVSPERPPRLRLQTRLGD